MALFGEELEGQAEVAGPAARAPDGDTGLAAVRSRAHRRAGRADRAHRRRARTDFARRAADCATALRRGAKNYRGHARHRDGAGRPAGADPGRPRRGRSNGRAFTGARHRRQAQPAHGGRRHRRRLGHPRVAACQRRADHRSPAQSERDLARQEGQEPWCG